MQLKQTTKMKISFFKSRFLQLSREEQQQTIDTLEKAKPADYLQGIKPEDHEGTKTAFNKLIEWCKENKSFTPSDVINQLATS